MILSGPTVGPLVTPLGLKSLVLSPRTVWLEWHDPSLGRAQKITDGRYYIVSYTNVPDGEEKTVTVKVGTVKQDIFLCRKCSRISRTFPACEYNNITL